MRLLAEPVDRRPELDAPAAVLEVEEGHLALAAARRQPAGHAHRLGAGLAGARAPRPRRGPRRSRAGPESAAGRGRPRAARSASRLGAALRDQPREPALGPGAASGSDQPWSPAWILTIWYSSGAARRRDRDLLALLAAEQGLADRALVGEAVVLRVGLGRADDRVLAGGLALGVLERHPGADRDRLGRDVLGVDHAGVAQLLLERLDAVLELGLLVLGVVVLRVLGDVAELARLLDPLRHLAALGRREVLDLLLELGVALFGEDHFAVHRITFFVGGRRDERRRKVASLSR